MVHRERSDTPENGTGQARAPVLPLDIRPTAALDDPPDGPLEDVEEVVVDPEPHQHLDRELEYLQRGARLANACKAEVRPCRRGAAAGEQEEASRGPTWRLGTDQTAAHMGAT